jgi:hypothetical protein
MANATAHAIQWVTASPLWHPTAPEAKTMQPPAILRFTTDKFMEELQQRLQTTPRSPRPDLAPLVAKWESFREKAWPDGTPFDDDPADPVDAPPKLYQPLHGHFYLVAANLVCRLPGLPDHVVNLARGERVGFVMRQLTVDGSGELCWVPSTADPKVRQWRLLDDPAQTDPDEELFPLFPFAFQEEGKLRRLQAGLIPVSSREAFEAADLVGNLPALPSAVPETRYLLRCVYRRTRCGPLHPDVVGAASTQFTLAAFLDFDAPARPVQIPLPTDTSLGALKRFKRNVGLVISKQLSQNMSKIGPLKDLSDGKTQAQDPNAFGEICMLSIPIITLCAMIVLYIFLSLLNIIFFWMPLLKICIPYPKAR